MSHATRLLCLAVVFAIAFTAVTLSLTSYAASQQQRLDCYQHFIHNGDVPQTCLTIAPDLEPACTTDEECQQQQGGDGGPAPTDQPRT